MLGIIALGNTSLKLKLQLPVEIHEINERNGMPTIINKPGPTYREWSRYFIDFFNELFT